MPGRATSVGRRLIVDDEGPVGDVLDEYFADGPLVVDGDLVGPELAAVGTALDDAHRMLPSCG